MGLREASEVTEEKFLCQLFWWASRSSPALNENSDLGVPSFI